MWKHWLNAMLGLFRRRDKEDYEDLVRRLEAEECAEEGAAPVCFLHRRPMIWDGSLHKWECPLCQGR